MDPAQRKPGRLAPEWRDAQDRRRSRPRRRRRDPEEGIPEWDGLFWRRCALAIPLRCGKSLLAIEASRRTSTNTNDSRNSRPKNLELSRQAGLDSCRDANGANLVQATQRRGEEGR